ncbi:MAG TPA: response regulator, partial [Pyrinomonadaceae bacterium]|nr:response regulator [Pyrinomonadaceae bacterium]
MNNKGRILILDDSDEWKVTLRLLLENAGYYVDVAASLEEAQSYLQNSFYHVAIFDIRLVDSDTKNIQGLELLEELYQNKMLGDMKIIVFSAYGTKELMRETFRQYRVTDFLEKDNFDGTDFITTVKNAFSEIKLNLNLNVDWKFSSSEQAVLNLKLPGNIRVKKDTKLQKQLSVELSDLLSRLFYEADTILVKPIKTGGSGTNVLIVEAFYENLGGSAPMVVKFGATKEISVEVDNFKKYVQGFIESGRHAALIDTKYTSHLGGIVYKLLGTSGEHLESFAHYYSNSTISQIKETLNNLFYGTCHSWYKSPGVIHPINLTEYYSKRMVISKEKLFALLLGLKIKPI